MGGRLSFGGKSLQGVMVDPKTGASHVYVADIGTQDIVAGKKALWAGDDADPGVVSVRFAML